MFAVCWILLDKKCKTDTTNLFISFPPAFPQKGGNAVVDGCGPAQNGTEMETEEYTLMSIDTIINGKVRIASNHGPRRDFLSEKYSSLM